MRRRVVVTALTLARLPFVGLGYWGAFRQDPLSTVTFGLTAVATDIADGRLARRWDVESEFGSNLDSAADFCFYTSLLIWTMMFVREPMERHLGLVTAFFAAYVVMLTAGYFFKRSIAAHNRVSRTAATVAGLVALWFMTVGYEPWMLFTVALFATADLAQRLHSVVQAIAMRRWEQTDP